MLGAAIMLASATVPTADAEVLGRMLAGQGTLATLLPMQIAKDTDDLVASHPELSPAETADLRAIAATTGAAASERLFTALGHRYATTLSEPDLRALTIFYASPVAVRFRAIQPQAIATTMAALDGFDFKRDALAAFCARTGKACAK